MELPYFGQINNKALEEVYEVKYQIDDIIHCPLELWFESESLQQEELEPISKALENIPKYIEASKINLLSDPVGIAILDKYLNHHLDVLSESEKEKLGCLLPSIESSKEALKNKIHIKSISIWQGNDDLLKIDYTIGHLITDYVICQNMNINFTVTSVEIES